MDLENLPYGDKNGESPLNEEYRKLGGWLLFFVIATALTIVFNIRAVFTESIYIIRIMNSGVYFRNLQLVINVIIFGLALVLTAVLFQFMGFVQILQRRSLFLLFIQAGQILIIVSNILMFFVPLGLIGFENYDVSSITGVCSKIAASCVGFFVITLYYFKSVRVHTYMGNYEYMRKSISIYKQKFSGL